MLATKIVLALQQFEVLIVCPKIFMPHILTIFHRNTHTCERIAIEIDERENFQDILIDLLSSFTRKIHRNKNQFLTEIYTGEC